MIVSCTPLSWAKSRSLLTFYVQCFGKSLRTVRSMWTHSMDLKSRCFWNFFWSSKRMLAKQREFMPPERQTTSQSLSTNLILFCRLILHLYSTFLREQALHIDSPLQRTAPGYFLHLKQLFILLVSLTSSQLFQTGSGSHFSLLHTSPQHCDVWHNPPSFCRASISASGQKIMGSSPKPQGKSSMSKNYYQLNTTSNPQYISYHNYMQQTYLSTVDRYLFGSSYPNRLHEPMRFAPKLVCFRIGCLVYLTAIYTWSLVLMPSIKENIIYLTMESYFLTWVYFALTIQDYFANSLERPEYFKGLWKLCCLLHQVALCAQVPVTIVFWGFLFRIILDMNVSTAVIALNANLHAGPFICLTLDYCFNTIQFRPRHYWLIFVYGALYMLFNMVYSLMFKPIYKPIDWVSLLSYGIVIGSFLSTYGVHVLARYLNTKWKKGGITAEQQREQEDVYSKIGDGPV